MAKPSSANPDDRRDMDDGGDPGIPYAKTDDPVKIDGPSSSENSRLWAATAIQSDVEPEDYTAEQREEQVAAAVDGHEPGRGKKPTG
jgi:hypothetical protein